MQKDKLNNYSEFLKLNYSKDNLTFEILYFLYEIGLTSLPFFSYKISISYLSYPTYNSITLKQFLK